MVAAGSPSTVVGAEDVLVCVPQSQRIKVKRDAEFHRVDALCHARIYPEQFASRASELVLTFRASMRARPRRRRRLKIRC